MQSYLKWKEDNEVTTELIRHEDVSPLDKSIEDLNKKEPFKYRKQLAAYRKKLSKQLEKGSRKSDSSVSQLKSGGEDPYRSTSPKPPVRLQCAASSLSTTQTNNRVPNGVGAKKKP